MLDIAVVQSANGFLAGSDDRSFLLAQSKAIVDDDARRDITPGGKCGRAEEGIGTDKSGFVGQREVSFLGNFASIGISHSHRAEGGHKTG